MTYILTLNAGSSSIKFSVYEPGAQLTEVAAGQIDRLETDSAHLTIERDGKKTERELGPKTQSTAMDAILVGVENALDGASIIAVGHRIVHGGGKFSEPVVLTSDVVDELESLVPLAPLHQPHNLAAVRTASKVFPDAIQVGCFDTGFHNGHPFVNDVFAIPRKYYDAGVRRYGFHGLSYDYVTGKLGEIDPEAYAGRTVVAHLGNGASMCAILGGKSIGSSIGFSTVDGLPMGTRCGQLDPGVILYLLEYGGMTPAEVTDMLYKKSGLLGLSESSSDMRTLEATDTIKAKQAIDYFVFRIRRELGAMAAILGGVDTFIFCGGIGENSVKVRGKVCEGMEWLGIKLDAAANNCNADIISTGPVTVRVIPTDEEIVLARATLAALERDQVSAAE